MSHRGAIFSLLVVALWIPELRLLLTDQLALTDVLVRMGIAVLAAWAAVALVSRVVAAYQQHNEGVASPEDRGA